MLTELMKNAALGSLRKATVEDAYDISVLVNSAYRGESSKLGWTSEADLLGGQRTDPEQIIDIIQKTNSAILLLFSSSQTLVGCVELEIKNSSTAYLGMLTVAPTLQASGLGRYILQEAENFVRKEWRCSVIEMKVIELRTELLEWYQRRGYALSSEKGAFPMNNPRFGIPKRQDLDFVVLKKNL